MNKSLGAIAAVSLLFVCYSSIFYFSLEHKNEQPNLNTSVVEAITEVTKVQAEEVEVQEAVEEPKVDLRYISYSEKVLNDFWMINIYDSKEKICYAFTWDAVKPRKVEFIDKYSCEQEAEKVAQ